MNMYIVTNADKRQPEHASKFFGLFECSELHTGLIFMKGVLLQLSNRLSQTAYFSMWVVSDFSVMTAVPLAGQCLFHFFSGVPELYFYCLLTSLAVLSGCELLSTYMWIYDGHVYGCAVLANGKGVFFGWVTTCLRTDDKMVVHLGGFRGRDLRTYYLFPFHNGSFCDEHIPSNSVNTLRKKGHAVGYLGLLVTHFVLIL